MSHPTADAARKFIRTAGVPSYEGYELQIRELADALDATMTDTNGPILSEREMGRWDSETWEDAAESVARTLAGFRLGLDADDPFAYNSHEKLCAGHIVGRLSAQGLLKDTVVLNAQAALVKELTEAITAFGKALCLPNGPSLAVQRHDPSWEAWKRVCDASAALTKYKAAQ